MKRMLSSFLVLSLVLSGNAAWAQDTKGETLRVQDTESMFGDFGVFARAAIYSDYVFRGYNLYDGMSFQPNVGAFYEIGEWGRIGASVWMHVPLESGQRKQVDVEPDNVVGSGDSRDIVGAFDFTDVDNPRVNFIEIDPTLSYDFTVLEALNVSVGHTWYTDPHEGVQTILFSGDPDGEFDPVFVERTVSRGDTSEFYVSLALDWYLNPEFTFVMDYRKYEYEYYTLGFSQPIPLNEAETLSLTPFVKFAWSTGNDFESTSESDSAPSGIYENNGLIHVNVGASMAVQVDNYTITPIVTYVFTEDGFISKDNLVWAGFSVDFDV